MNKNKTLPLQLPKALLDSLQKVKGFDEDAFVKTHQQNEAVTSIRYNPAKSAINNLQSIINIPWCPHGFYLPERPSFTFDPLFHAGTYYVQEASSMFLWQVLKQTFGQNTDGAKVLDLCAAPGGKSTLLASYFKGGLIVANEVIRSRANILVENITKWGSGNVVVTNNDPKDFSKLEGFFDVIVIDAPCSGSGLFRKDNDAINEWSEENVILCSLRQQRIAADVLPALKEDGILIYSTCSYSKEENENILDWMISNFQLSTINCQPDKEWNIVETLSEKGAFGYRFYPDKIKGEGFFIAAFKKNGREIEENYFSTSFSIPSKSEIALVNDWIKEEDGLFLFKQNEKIIAVEERWKNDIAFLQSNFYLRKAGVAVGSVKGKDFVPEHELALSSLVNKKIKKVELSKQEAIQYLQKKELVLNDDIKGWALATCLNKNLGWIKILHNRVNNYYPKEWRILKD